MRTVLLVLGGMIVLLVLAGIGFVALNWAPERSVADLQRRWGQPPSTFLDIEGMRFHLRDEGPRDDPNPIVLMHGTGSSLHAWNGWTAELAKTRRVIRYDLAGFGLTGPSPGHVYGVEHDVRHLIALLDRLGVSRAVLGGNSLGGAIAWRAALLHPDRVAKLILVDAGAYPVKSESVPLGFQLARLPGVGWLLQNTLPRSLVEQGFRNVFGDPARVTPEMIERSIELTQREGNRRALLDRFRQRRPSNLADRIPELKLPTLILWGGRDRLIPVSVAHRLHREIEGSTLVVFDDLGHAPEEEDPERTLAPVLRFLAPLPPQG